MSIVKRAAAEFLGTFWLTFAGCGSAVLSAAVFVEEGASPINIGIDLVGVALAFGLATLTMGYAIGHISGCHLNPAVSLGLLMGRRFSAADLVPYVVAQILGAVTGAAVLYLIASGQKGFAIRDSPAMFATNGYGERSPNGYTLLACLVAEVVLTFMFVLIVLGATDRRAPAGFAPLAIGLGLTVVHLIGIPVTNLSVNPARSIGPAVFVYPALQQVWLFIAAPVIGAVLAGFVYPLLAGEAGE